MVVTWFGLVDAAGTWAEAHLVQHPFGVGPCQENLTWSHVPRQPLEAGRGVGTADPGLDQSSAVPCWGVLPD